MEQLPPESPSHPGNGRYVKAATINDILEELRQAQHRLTKPEGLLVAMQKQHQHFGDCMLQMEKELDATRQSMQGVTKTVEQVLEQTSPLEDLVGRQISLRNIQQVEIYLPVSTQKSHASASLERKNGGSDAKCEGLHMTARSSMYSRILNRSLQQKLQASCEAPLPAISDAGFAAFAVACVRRAVRHSHFDAAIGVVIALNSILLGFEAEANANGYTVEWADTLEIIFIVIYISEIILRLISDGRDCFFDAWFLFDFFLVLVSAFGLITSMVTSSFENSFLSTVMILRALRLLRLLRALRMIKQLKAMWRLVYGIMTCAGTIASTLTLLAVTLYVFSVLGVEMIARNETLQADEETRLITRKHFGSIPATLMTLTQFVTMDSIAAIYTPIITAAPGLAVYFLSALVVISIALMNLVTAVLVEGSLEHARHDREEEKRLLNLSIKNTLPDILKVFDQIDKDGSGLISLDEIVGEKIDIIPAAVLDKASVDSMKELFEMLDVDESGNLTREEFTDGLLSIVLLDVPIPTLQQMKLIRLLRTQVSAIQLEVSTLLLQARTSAETSTSSIMSESL